LLANLAARGEQKIHSATIAVCLLDMAVAEDTTQAWSPMGQNCPQPLGQASFSKTLDTSWSQPVPL
jgi:hypothetical protein